MAVTVTGIRQTDPVSVYRVADDFGDAMSAFQRAEERLRTGVKTPLGAGHAWNGGGQADAEGVVEINRLALTISGVQMQAAKSATSGLAGALTTARSSLLTQLDDARNNQVTVNDDGTTSYEQPTSATPTGVAGGGGPYGDFYGANAPERARRREAAERIEREVKGILAFATLADENCKSLLNAVAQHLPRHSSTNDPNVHAHNRWALGQAERNRDLAAGAERLWESAYPKPEPEEPGLLSKLWRGTGEFFGNLFEDPGRLATEAGSIALGLALVALGSGAEVGGVALDATGIGAVVGVPVNVAAAAVIATGATTAGLGAVSLANHAGTALAEARGSGGGSSAPRFKPGDNARASRSYGRTAGDVKGQANTFAKRMRQRGFKADVPPVRYDKYGRADYTVAVYKKTPNGWVQHHVRHFLQKQRTGQ